MEVIQGGRARRRDPLWLRAVYALVLVFAIVVFAAIFVGVVLGILTLLELFWPW